MRRPASPRRSRTPTWPRPRAIRFACVALAAAFGLSQIDVDLLVIALAADLDPRFERFFGYLNDDVGRRRPSIAVALELCGVPLTSAADRARLISGPLVSGGLVIVEDEERPLPGRAVRVPDRVVGHLLGDDTPDRALEGVLREPSTVDWGDPSRCRARARRRHPARLPAGAGDRVGRRRSPCAASARAGSTSCSSTSRGSAASTTRSRSRGSRRARPGCAASA